jgi:Lon protease-like protein
MSTVEETVRPEEDAVAEVLPILPLKETVVFPDSMTPLAVGQVRSFQLVDEAVANDSRKRRTAPRTSTTSEPRRSSTR